MGYFLMVLLFFVSILMMFIVLLQRGRGGGLAGALGGMGGQSVLGTKAGDVFTKITVTLAVIWVLLAGFGGMALRNASSKYDDSGVAVAPEDGDDATGIGAAPIKAADDATSADEGTATTADEASDAKESSATSETAEDGKDSTSNGNTEPPAEAETESSESK
jgi:preprotein translocase subunit SecG